MGAGAALWKTSGKTAAAARTVGTVAAEQPDVVLAPLPRRDPPRPALVPIAAGVTNLGSTPDEAREAREQCTDEVGVAACPAASFDRETPTARAEVPAFRLATNEITNRELFDWLASAGAGANMGPLRLHRRDGAIWIADAEGELAALAGDATPEAGLRADGNTLSLVPERADDPAVWTARRVAQRLCHDAGLRLPRAAEWEWAARGDKRRLFPWGEAMFHCQRAVAARQPGLACATLPRGPASVLEPPLPDRTPEGVRDLAGNVAEWVADPAPPSWADAGRTCRDGDCFVIKGGDWASPSWRARAASLRAAPGSFAAGWLGWRCAGEER
jgi:formylglycine-generating enzyme required for sulfatase activity